MIASTAIICAVYPAQAAEKIAIGAEERWHLDLAQLWIVQYNFYINDQRTVSFDSIGDLQKPL